MNKTSLVYSVRYLAYFVLFSGLGFPGMAKEISRTGEAIVVAKTGSAEARVYTGPVHEGQTKTIELFDGAAVGETSRIMTGKDGRLCVVLTPGAVICVAPETEFTVTELRHTADGLPASEKDIIRKITLDLHRGRILVHAGVPSALLEIKIRTEVGAVESGGGSFVVAQRGTEGWSVFCEQYEIGVVPKGGLRTAVSSGQGVWMGSGAGGGVELKQEESPADSPLRQFELCREYFQDLETFMNPIIGFDRIGLAGYLSRQRAPIFLGSTGVINDVSPSYRPTALEMVLTPPPSEGIPGDVRRWGVERIWNWWERVGVLRGVNYIPRTAVNSTEMWRKDTFDENTIDEELGWAQAVGYNALRVQLQYVAWKEDPDGFLDRVERFLELAGKHGLRVVPVIFDDLNLAHRDPVTGPQPGPEPTLHNAQWTPSPGPVRVTDRFVWPDLEAYEKAVLKKFKKEDRILFWDLYNTAGNDALWEKTLPLMDQAFNWAREIDPEQPLSVPAWKEFGSAMTARELERSDLVTFHSFASVENVQALLLLMQRYNRPIVCTDWLLRQEDNTFEKILPLFSNYRVGWFNRGLVQGKTQQWIQQPEHRTDRPADLWQHDVLTPEGKGYKDSELQLIQGFRYMEVR